MRKYLVLAVTVLVMSVCSLPSAYAQSRDAMRLVKKYNRIEGAERINLGGMLFSIIKQAAGDGPEAKEALKHLKKITVFTMEDCDEASKTRFNADAQRLFSSYEPMMEVKDGEESVSIFAKMSADDSLKELVLYMAEDATLILIKGNLPSSMISEIVQGAL